MNKNKQTGKKIIYCYVHAASSTKTCLPFNVAFFKTFMAYSVPTSGPFIFLTRNT